MTLALAVGTTLWGAWWAILLYVLSIVGVGVAARRWDAADRIPLATLLAFFFVSGLVPTVFERYFLPLLPGLMILTARVLVGTRPWPRVQAAFVVGLVLHAIAMAV